MIETPIHNLKHLVKILWENAVPDEECWPMARAIAVDLKAGYYVVWPYQDWELGDKGEPFAFMANSVYTAKIREAQRRSFTQKRRQSFAAQSKTKKSAAKLSPKMSVTGIWRKGERERIDPQSNGEE
tara:strand:+ start:1842 stop:2222 length:381 start_codon:yes stop_codon:yes gene_type:complete